MEFSIAGHPGDFFPVSVTFTSRKSYCDLKVFSVFCNSMPKKSHTYKLSCNSTDIYLNLPTQTCIGVFLILLWYCSTIIFLSDVQQNFFLLGRLQLTSQAFDKQYSHRYTAPLICVKKFGGKGAVYPLVFMVLAVKCTVHTCLHSVQVPFAWLVMWSNVINLISVASKIKFLFDFSALEIPRNLLQVLSFKKFYISGDMTVVI